MPSRPRIDRQYLPFGDGRSVPVKVATATVSGVKVEVGHGALDATLTSEVHTAIENGGTGLVLDGNKKAKPKVHEIAWQGVRGYDASATGKSSSARVRVLFHGSRIVYVVVSGEDDVDLVFDTVTESIRLR
jgi:hypothetical protein